MQIETGSFSINSPFNSEVNAGNTATFFEVTFCNPFDTDRVIVIPFVQSFNGVHTPGLRIAEVNRNGFKIRMNEVIGRINNIPARGDGQHVSEQIGYIALKLNCEPKVSRPNPG